MDIREREKKVSFSSFFADPKNRKIKSPGASVSQLVDRAHSIEAIAAKSHPLKQESRREKVLLLLSFISPAKEVD